MARGLAYDALLVATGGRARRLSVPGAELPGVLHLRTLETPPPSIACSRPRPMWRSSAAALSGSLASAAVTRGVAVTLLEREREIMARVLPAPLGRAFRQLAQRHGVGHPARRRGDGDPAAWRTAQSDRRRGDDRSRRRPRRHRIGARRRACSGGRMRGRGRHRGRCRGRASIPGIWAAGDCALYPQPRRRPPHLPGELAQRRGARRRRRPLDGRSGCRPSR